MSTTAKWLRHNRATVRTVSLLLAVALVSALVLDLHAHTAHAATQSQATQTACAHTGLHDQRATAPEDATNNVAGHFDDFGAPDNSAHESCCDCAHCFFFVTPRPAAVRGPRIIASRSRVPAQPMHSHLPNLLDRPPIASV